MQESQGTGELEDSSRKTSQTEIQGGKKRKKSNPEIEYPKTVEQFQSCTICANGTPEEKENGA